MLSCDSLNMIQLNTVIELNTWTINWHNHYYYNQKIDPLIGGERPVNVECTILFYHSLKVAFKGNTDRITE